MFIWQAAVADVMDRGDRRGDGGLNKTSTSEGPLILGHLDPLSVHNHPAAFCRY
jgi:hypothetical protein